MTGLPTLVVKAQFNKTRWPPLACRRDPNKIWIPGLPTLNQKERLDYFSDMEGFPKEVRMLILSHLYLGEPYKGYDEEKEECYEMDGLAHHVNLLCVSKNYYSLFKPLMPFKKIVSDEVVVVEWGNYLERHKVRAYGGIFDQMFTISPEHVARCICEDWESENGFSGIDLFEFFQGKLYCFGWISNVWETLRRYWFSPSIPYNHGKIEVGLMRCKTKPKFECDKDKVIKDRFLVCFS